MTLIPPATDLARLDLPRPYLLFLGDVTEAGYAKTAFGLRDWAREQCVGELSFANAISVGLPRLTPSEARACGARSMVIGVANVGGRIGRGNIGLRIHGSDQSAGRAVKVVTVRRSVTAAASNRVRDFI